MPGEYIYGNFSWLRDSVFAFCDNQLFLTCSSQLRSIQLCRKIFEIQFFEKSFLHQNVYNPKPEEKEYSARE